MRSIIALIRSWIQKIIQFFSGKNIVDEPDNTEVVDPGEVVCYYGCPNSNKARKLQLDRKIYR